MCVELRKLHDRLKTTTVFVTHDQNEAMALADHIVVMDQGEILQADDPNGIYRFPSCLFVAKFIGRPAMNLIKADAPVMRGDALVRIARRGVAVPRIDTPSASVILGVRPEYVRLLGADQGCIGGRVQHVEYFGSHWVVEVQTDAGPIKALADKSARPEIGVHVGLDFDTRHVVLFDAASEKLLASETTLAHKPGMRHG
jgi:multiple sugar transport system ATP-binding protein